MRIEQHEKPVPKERELLIKVHASAVNSADVRLRKADPFAVRFVYGLFAPKKPVLGVVFSGIVESAGKKVTRFKPGDAVFGSCDDTMGAHAEFLCVSETGAIALKPENLNFEEAAFIIFGGTTANYFLNRGNVAASKKVLVYGASGSVGSAAVQFAKSRGAYGTAVCSTWNLALMRTLRADAVLDYTIPGFMDGTERYDLIFETVNKTDITDCVWNLKPGGTLILGAAMLTEMLRGLRHTVFSSKKAVFGVALQKQSEIEVLAALAHAGKRKPVIDRIYPLEEIAAAHAYVDANHKKGNVVIRM